MYNALGMKKKIGVVHVPGRTAATDFSPKENP